MNDRRTLLRSLAMAVSMVWAGQVAAADRPGDESPARAAHPFPTGQYADLPGVHLWYLDQAPERGPGDRDATRRSEETVIFLHANTGTSQSWRPQLVAFAKAGYRAIAFDRRGWGKSLADPRTGVQPGTVTEDLHALVTALGLSKFHLVGVAGGGFVAMDYAAWHGDRLIDLVIASSTGSIAESAILNFSARIALPGVSLPSYYTEVGASYRGGDPDGFKAWQEIEEHARQSGAPSQPLRSPNTFAKLQSIVQRTLIMPSDADLLAPPALMRIWAPYVRRGEWAMIPDAGHAANTEQPELFNKTVLRFMAGERFEAVGGR